MPTTDAHLLQALFEGSPEAVVVASLDRKIVGGNPAFTEMFGWGLDDVRGRSTAILYADPEEFERQGVVRFHRGAAANRERYTVRYRRSCGDVLFGDTVGTIVMGPDGPVGFLAIIRDVTETTQAFERLEKATAEIAEREAHLHAIYSKTPAMLHSLDAAGRIVDVSDHWLSAMGYARDEVLGRSSFDFLTPESRKRAVEVDLPRFLSVGACDHLEYAFVRKDGSIMNVLLSAVVDRGPDGEAARALAVITDVTEMTTLQGELQAAKAAATRASDAKSRFLAAMGHEIRTPMNGVLGAASYLAHSDLDPTQRNMVGIIETAGAALMELLNDLLDISKAEAGCLALEQRTFPLDELVEDLARSYALQAEAKGLAFKLEPPRARALLRGDPLRLQQIAHNLLSNALKFTEKGEIALRVSVAPEQPVSDAPARLTLQVSDTGKGVSREHQRVIFNPFDQGEAGVARRHGGTGLGLTLVRELCEAMGGSIRVKSRPGEGATFTAEVVLTHVDPQEDAARLPALEVGAIS